MSTNNIYSGSHTCPGPRSMMFRCWCTKPAARPTWGSYKMPLSRWYQDGGSQHSPRSPGGPQVRPEVIVAQHTLYHCKHKHILIAASFSRPDVSYYFSWFTLFGTNPLLWLCTTVILSLYNTCWIRLYLACFCLCPSSVYTTCHLLLIIIWLATGLISIAWYDWLPV